MSAKAKNTQLDSGRLEILITIVNRKKADSITDFLQSFEVNMQLAVPAEGTASIETLNMIGLAHTDRTVIFSVIREDKAEEAMDALEKRFKLVHGGKGIACTVPMSSVIGVLIFGFLSNDRRAVKS